jgi:hypothetical protein
MLDLCLFGVTKRIIARANRLEKVNVQTDHIVRVLHSFMSPAVPSNIVKSFPNSGRSLILDDERIIRCQITPHTARCVLSEPFELELSDGSSEDGEDLNVEMYLEAFGRLLYGVGEIGSEIISGEDDAGEAD